MPSIQVATGEIYPNGVPNNSVTKTPDGVLHVAMRRKNGTSFEAVWTRSHDDGKTWIETVIATVSSGAYCGIVSDSNGHLYFAWVQGYPGQMWFMRIPQTSPGVWVNPSTITPLAVLTPVYTPYLLIDETRDRLHISGYGPTVRHRSLKLSTQVLGTVTTDFIPAWQYTQIAVDPDSDAIFVIGQTYGDVRSYINRATFAGGGAWSWGSQFRYDPGDGSNYGVLARRLGDRLVALRCKPQLRVEWRDKSLWNSGPWSFSLLDPVPPAVFVRALWRAVTDDLIEVIWYDTNGDVHKADFNLTTSSWGTPELLDITVTEEDWEPIGGDNLRELWAWLDKDASNLTSKLMLEGVVPSRGAPFWWGGGIS